MNFNHSLFDEVRVSNKNSGPWFSVKALGYSKTSSMNRSLAADERRMQNVHPQAN